MDRIAQIIDCCTSLGKFYDDVVSFHVRANPGDAIWLSSQNFGERLSNAGFTVQIEYSEHLEIGKLLVTPITKSTRKARDTHRETRADYSS